MRYVCAPAGAPARDALPNRRRIRLRRGDLLHPVLSDFHILLAMLLALLIRGNLIASGIGTVVGNPWTFPLIWFVGHIPLDAGCSVWRGAATFRIK